MILGVSCDQASFKELEFRPGLNVLLADKSQGATDRQSRNGAGKTSFVELIHFLFGAEARPNSIFRSKALQDWTFTVSFSVNGDVVKASRCGKKPSKISCASECRGWPTKADSEFLSNGLTLKNADWNRDLGELWFGLSEPEDGERFRPTFRSLFSMVARRQESGGFLRPTQHFERQQLWDQQAILSHLIGLDTTIPARFQELRVRERITADLRRHAKSGELGRYLGKAGELRTRLAVAEAHSERLRQQIGSFRVVAEYEELEREASRITGEINGLNEENLADRNLLRELQASLESEHRPESPDLNKLYREAGIVLPELTQRRLAEVERFHETILQNRRSHLESEINSADKRIAERDQTKVRLDQRRAQVMGMLKSGGALEHFTSLREELGRAESEVTTLKERLETAERLESTQTELNLQRNQLVQKLRDDIRERNQNVREAILGFEALSQSLYERAGSLTLDDTPNGLNLSFHIDAERSKGITNMQIFCFDLMLAEIGMRRGRWPGFLIHDSHLFDGVDERQVAKALQLGAERAEALGFQYIVTMNSDAVPSEGFKPGFNLDNHLLDQRLTDATETGGLFGVRFN
ncbi:MAG: DUF2326 domain-containing protein [Gammaproteobacteria bacterium]|nr:DUF2326 domain-containing protein [Gammaproteobacteria bacterium]MDE0508599.1 DUF2326 domain-containing protein [Gammaproteobacteria bacterium]